MLRTARNKAGITREEAAHRIYIGTRTLADYELGRTIAPPDVVMRMAEVYREPTLPADYCAKVCPIGQVLAHCVDRLEFATTVLRVIKEFTDVKGLLDDLVRIASDGRVNPHEEAEFTARGGGGVGGMTVAKTNRIVFQNANGTVYFVIAGNANRALLRAIDYGGYVIARGLDWIHMSWGGGSYYSADEFELAVKAFFGEGETC